MQFSLDRFYRINRRAFIWIALFALIYILRDFFALIFLTFILVSFTLPFINYMERKTRAPRRVIISLLYFVITAGVTGLIYYIVPVVFTEAISGVGELYSLRTKITEARNSTLDQYPNLKPLMDMVMRFDFESYIHKAQAEMQILVRDAAKIALFTISTIYLSLLFAFLIVFDLTRLTEEIRRFERSRLHDFYEQSAEPVVKFASVIANTFRAQAMIAFVNTVLTFIGFAALGIPKIALLTVIVFFFSFIPVLGVFISTAPAVLVAMNYGGAVDGVKVIIFVIVIHMIEAYILNPFIYGQHLKLNPVLVLIILYVGHHFFGLWGMLLGVPVAYYFIHYVFKVPSDNLDITDPEVPKSYLSGDRDLRVEKTDEVL